MWIFRVGTVLSLTLCTALPSASCQTTAGVQRSSYRVISAEQTASEALRADVERTNKIVMQLFEALQQRQENCEQQIKNYMTEIYSTAVIVDRISQVKTDKGSSMGKDALNKMLDLAVKDAMRPDGRVCLSEMIKSLQMRLTAFENAFSDGKAGPGGKVTTFEGPTPAPPLPGSSPSENTTPPAVSFPRMQTGLPYDATSTDRLAICEGAALLKKCLTHYHNGRRLHGDLYENCNGERILLLH